MSAPRLYIQCAGSVSIDGQPMGRLDPAAYEILADHVPPDLRGYEHGDSLMFELRLVQIQNTPVAVEDEPEDSCE